MKGDRVAAVDARLTAVDPEARPGAARDAAAQGKVDLREVRESADGCRACDLWERATQTVFGRGPVPARLMLVGEQPGDQEDVRGEPFVGPAGRILDQALEEAGINRDGVFVTNVVKHFKWRPAPSGKRRLHERPDRVEIGACLPWVETELALVRPEAIVLLGATAAKALVGSKVRVTRDRGVPLEIETGAPRRRHDPPVRRATGKRPRSARGKPGGPGGRPPCGRRPARQGLAGSRGPDSGASGRRVSRARSEPAVYMRVVAVFVTVRGTSGTGHLSYRPRLLRPSRGCW